MSDATAGMATIRPDEAAHFAGLAADWWNPKGRSAMLHRLNPVRLGFIRDAIDKHWAADKSRSGTRSHTSSGAKPLAGKRALDLGCGAGLVAEPLARLGAKVTGVDAAAANIEAARQHAQGAGLAITYRHGELADLGLGQFDLITCLEVLEHVADKPALVAGLARHLAPGGLLVLSTPNRTARSALLLVGAAEALGLVPRGTHHWRDFVTPEEAHTLLAEAGLAMAPPRGIVWSPAEGFTLSGDLSLNFITTATLAAT